MVMRYSIICPGCDAPFVVRLTLAPSKMTRFYVPCPACRLPIRARSHGKELDSHRVEFDAEWYRGKDEPTLVVTTDPHVPSRYDATILGQPGSGPTLTLLHLVGQERMHDLMRYMGGGRNAVDSWWPQVRRIYEYYLEGDWERFDKAGRAALKSKWQRVETTHERATAAHQAVGLVLSEIVGPSEVSDRFLSRWMKKHTAALNSKDYIVFARSDAENDLISTFQRQVFDTIDLFIERFDSWQMGLLFRVMPGDRMLLLDEMRLFRDEFDILRDLYQQGFETTCKTLRYLVAAENTAIRGRLDDFGSSVPPLIRRKSNPRTVVAFEKLPNHDKLQYVKQVPGWEGWVSLLDNQTRNAISHASVRHDLRTGLVISDAVPSGVPYLNVAGDVYGVFEAIGLCLQVLRGIRIVSSPDF